MRNELQRNLASITMHETDTKEAMALVSVERRKVPAPAGMLFKLQVAILWELVLDLVRVRLRQAGANGLITQN